MAKTVIDELVTLFTLRSDKKSGKVVSGLRTRLVALKRVGLIAGAALTAAGAGVGILIKKTNESVDAQAKFAKTVNTSFENLQALQFAGKLVGVSMDDINSALENLSTTMDPAIPGQYNRELLLLGISSKTVAGKLRSPIAVLIDIADKIKKLSKGKQLSLLKTFGFSPGVTRLLLAGPKAIAKAMKEARASGAVLPEGSAKTAAKFDREVVRLTSSIKGMMSVMLLGLTPAISKALAGWEKYIIANRKVIALKIKDFILGVALGFKNFINVVIKVKDVIGDIINSFGKLIGGFQKVSDIKTTAVIIEGIMFGMAAAFLAANIEIVAVVAAITALILLAPKIKSVLSAFSKAGKKVPDQLRKSFGLDDPKVRAGLGIDSPRFKAANPVFARLLRNPSKFKIPIGKITTANTAVSNQSTAQTTNNVTIHVNGAQNPLSVAKEVIKNIPLSAAVQTASPGINAPPVG